jgi:transposase
MIFGASSPAVFSKERAMDTIFARCAGLDVHKESAASCVRRIEADAVKQEVRTFGTMTADLPALADWLSAP